MPLPIAGSVIVEVLRAAPVAIHGDLYVDLECRVAETAEPELLRVPAHVMPPSADGQPRLPAAGDRLEIAVLLGQVDAVRRVEA